jgi:hypothetical protein
VIRGDRKPCKPYDSERVNTTNNCKMHGKRAVARVRHALSFCAMPSRLDMQILCRFSIGRGWSRYDLAMTWERHASELQLFCMVFGDFRPKLEVHINVNICRGLCVFM